MAYLTTAELEFLAPKNRMPPSGSVLDLEAGSTYEPVWPRFETVEVCQQEDRSRAAALRQLDESLLSSLFDNDDDDWLLERDAGELATLLEQIADPERTLPTPPCLASSLYLRSRRIGVLGATVELVAAHPELERAWFTGRHPALQFRANGRGSRVIVDARSRLQQHLQVSGANSASGLLIAFLNGHFEPELERICLQYRGLVVGDKLAALRPPVHFTSLPRGHRGLAIALHPIADLSQQITRIMPSCLRERVAAAPGNAPTVNRMREPYHSMYLLWLARRRLADLIIVDGAFYWNGGLELRACYAEAGADAPASS